MATGTASGNKNQYKNVTSGWVGVVVKGAKGELGGIAIAPGEEVWMDEDERVATANAPRNSADNPFANGSFEKTAEGGDARTNRDIDVPDEDEAPAPSTDVEEPPAGPGVPIEERPPAPAEETGDMPAPGEEATSTPLPAQGTRPDAEEVGDPAATEQAAQAAKAPRGEPTVRSGAPGGE